MTAGAWAYAALMAAAPFLLWAGAYAFFRRNDRKRGTR